MTSSALRLWLHYALAALAALAALGCQCSHSDSGEVAKVLSKDGEVTRDFRGREQVWSTAGVGTALSYGDALRTAQGSLAQLRVGRTGRVLVESDTIVRFLDSALTPQSAPKLELAQGSATLEAQDEELSIPTRIGFAILKPGTKLQLRPERDGDVYRVLVGSARFSQPDGKTVEVTNGQTIAVGIGLAVFDDAVGPPLRAAARVPSEAAVPSPTATEPAANAGQTTSEAAPKPSADAATRVRAGAIESGPPELVVPIGESFSVYDPAPPTRIGFALRGRCADAELRISSGPTLRGGSILSVELRPGTHTYAVHCLDSGKRRTLARGRVLLQRADFARPLPKSSPRNAVALDGHRYRLIYQSIRPILSVTWPSAPHATAYTLILESDLGATRTFEMRTPSFELLPDLLHDGKHSLTMQAHNAGRTRSEPTTVDIARDATAPSASLELPAPAGFVPGAPIMVRGSALAGTSLTIEGEPVALDARLHFTHTVTLALDRPALAVRFQHPSHGIRYVMRRAVHARR
jgi:hypothetical protein